MDLSGRHPSVAHFGPLFTFAHLPAHLRATSKACHDLAEQMTSTLPDGPELSAGLRKLLEAKDCFVRAALVPPTATPNLTAGGTTTSTAGGTAVVDQSGS